MRFANMAETAQSVWDLQQLAQQIMAGLAAVFRQRPAGQFKILFILK